MKFDLHNVLAGQAENISFAVLAWKTKRLSGTSTPNACSKYLYEANGFWQMGKTPKTLLYNNLDTAAVSVGYYGVVDQVKKWFAHPDQNFGLMIEPSRNINEADVKTECMESLEDLSLTVKYRFPRFGP